MKARYLSVFRCRQTLASRDCHITRKILNERLFFAKSRVPQKRFAGVYATTMLWRAGTTSSTLNHDTANVSTHGSGVSDMSFCEPPEWPPEASCFSSIVVKSGPKLDSGQFIRSIACNSCWSGSCFAPPRLYGNWLQVFVSYIVLTQSLAPAWPTSRLCTSRSECMLQI